MLFSCLLMKYRSRAIATLVAAFWLGLPTLWAAELPEPAEFFEKRVRPVLAENCFACHTDSKMGGLEMTSREALLQGGASGPAIVAGQPGRSLLIQAVRHTHERLKMPPQGRLEERQIADLTMWVERGAYWPAVEKAASGGRGDGKYVIPPEQRNFWSFQPIRDPEPPEAANESWVQSPVDRFILARLEEEGLDPVGSADKRTLIRRAYLDLTGLPPAPEQVDAFVNDESPSAFAELVDCLLESPRYGERWGRYWLDVARYADDELNSTQMDPYPNAFRYRDWVIRAFNGDMPYDLFVKAQIAGDLLPGHDKDRLAPALGFYGLSPQHQDDRVDATGRAFLGLTVACAQCHDHKFDPIPTEDYYALLGVFNSTKKAEHPLAPEPTVEEYKARQEAVREAVEARDEFISKQSEQLVEILAARTAEYLQAAWRVLGPGGLAIAEAADEAGLDAAVLQRWVRYLPASPKDHPFFEPWDRLLAEGADWDAVREFSGEVQQELLAVIKRKKEIDRENLIRTKGGAISRTELGKTELLSLERDRFYLWRDLASGSGFKIGLDPEAAAEFDSGVLYFDREEIGPYLSEPWKRHLSKLQQQVDEMKLRVPEPYPFAHVIRDVEEPANERVRIRGNENNLGDEVPRRFLAVLSPSPPAPFTEGSGRLELAEAIASPDNPLTARVMVNRIWMRHFGAGIVGTPSNFGRMGERPTHPELLDYLASRFIESGWSIKAMHREIMLSSAYQLSSDYVAENAKADPDNRLLWHFRPRRLDIEALRDSMLAVTGALDETPGGPPDPLDEVCSTRRTVYGYVSRRRLDTMLGLFDFPNPNVTSPRRVATNTPLQGLFLLNSEFVGDQAATLAWRLAKEAGEEDEARIRRAYRLLFARSPSKEELRMGLRFVNAGRGRWPAYAQILLISNQFLYLN